MIDEQVEQQSERMIEPEGSRKRLGRSAFGYSLYCEILRILRDPWAVLFGICMPSMFFLLFSTSLYTKYSPGLLAQYSAYAAFIAAFQTFSISLAIERARGWNKLMRATPTNALFHLGVKFLMVMCTGALSMIVLFSVSEVSGIARIPFFIWLHLFGFMLLGMIPFALAGIFLGFIGSPNAAQVLASILALLLSLTSGFYIPIQFMPTFIRALAPYLPTYHLTQVALYAVGVQSSDNATIWLHLITLAIFALLFSVLACWAYIKDEQKNFS